MNGHRPSWQPTTLGWVGLAGLTLVLHMVGRGALGPPPLSSAQHVATWWRQRGPLLATFAAAREILWWVGCYLLAVGVLAGLARWRQSAGLARPLSRCHLPGAATILRASIGASAVGASLLAHSGSIFAAGNGASGGPGGQDDGARPEAPPVLRYVGSADATPGGTSAATAPVPGSAGAMPASTSAATAPVLRYVGRAGKSPDGSSTPSTALGPRQGTGERSGGRSPSNGRYASGSVVRPASGTSAVSRRRPGATQPVRTASPTNSVAVSTRTWTVRPGDSLWSIAETALSAAWGQPADARLLGHYWWQVVETNRASLPIPANPDLLFPGDKVVLPPPPARPGRG